MVNMKHVFVGLGVCVGLAAGGDLILRGGTISIQSESAPTDFKSILVRPLVRYSER